MNSFHSVSSNSQTGDLATLLAPPQNPLSVAAATSQAGGRSPGGDASAHGGAAGPGGSGGGAVGAMHGGLGHAPPSIAGTNAAPWPRPALHAVAASPTHIRLTIRWRMTPPPAPALSLAPAVHGSSATTAQLPLLAPAGAATQGGLQYGASAGVAPPLVAPPASSLPLALSMCGPHISRQPPDAWPPPPRSHEDRAAFEAHRLSREAFERDPSLLLHPDLRVMLPGGAMLPWRAAAPVLISALAYGTPLGAMPSPLPMLPVAAAGYGHGGEAAAAAAAAGAAAAGDKGGAEGADGVAATADAAADGGDGERRRRSSKRRSWFSWGGWSGVGGGTSAAPSSAVAAKGRTRMAPAAAARPTTPRPTTTSSLGAAAAAQTRVGHRVSSRRGP